MGPGGESRSDVEAELESEEPMEMGDDMSASKDEGDRGAAMTLVECGEPMATPIDGGHGTEMRGDVPGSRKRNASGDATVEQVAKWAWSPCPSEAPSASQPPAPSVTERAGRLGECDCPPIPLGSPRAGGRDYS